MNFRRASLPSLAQLRTFLVVAEVGGFTKAAELLDLTQPAVTQQIRALAEHFGCPLFETVGKTPVLTEAGALLAQRVGPVLGSIVAIEREIHEGADARRGTLELGATLTIGNYALMPLLATFRETHPGIFLHLVIGSTASMVAAIKERRLAIALVEGSLDEPTLDVQSFAEDELVLVVPARGHRLSNVEAVEVNDLTSEAFITREGGAGLRSAAEDFLQNSGIEPAVVLSFPSGEGVARAVEAGLGIAVLSRLIVERAVEHQRLHVVKIENVKLTRTFRLVRLPQRKPSPLARQFIELLRSAHDFSALEPGR